MTSAPLRLLGLALITLFITGCGTTPPTRFYALTAEAPMADTQQDVSLNQPPSHKIIVGIGPIEVAPYLERNQIVTRSNGTRLNVIEFDRWAASIEDNIAGVLAINLSRQLPQTQPMVRPWPDAKAEYHVMVKFLQFDADEAGNVQLQASWGIQLRSTQDMPVIRDARIALPSIGADYAAITQNMSNALTGLSTQIATALRQQLTKN